MPQKGGASSGGVPRKSGGGLGFNEVGGGGCGGGQERETLLTAGDNTAPRFKGERGYWFRSHE